MENWLALGPGASGTLIDDRAGTGRRYTVKPDVDAWLDRPARDGNAGNPAAGPPVTEEALDRSTLIKESLLMGFRFTGGPDGALFEKRFGREIEEVIPRTIAAWRTRGLFQADRTALTRDGLLFLNPFLIDAFLELETCDIVKG
jgi:oxygen-independent coproporphyrinogen-3 oxidase